jgi:hypothetical protein
MTAMTDVRPIFENEEWLVTKDGLEHKTTGYFIERESLGQRREDGLWTWPLHMAEKSWCAMTPFAEAFSCAASVYNVETGSELARTFKVARREISAWPQVDQSFKQTSRASASGRLPNLRNEARTPIFLESDDSEKPLIDEGFRKLDDRRVRSQLGARPFSTATRIRSARYTIEKAPAPEWQVPYRIRRTGTKLVRLLQAAWNTR